MKPGKNGMETRRRGRRRLLLSVAVFVAVLIAIVSGVLRYRTADRHHDPLQATSIVYQMRQDPSSWARTDNDASRMLEDIREKRVTAIGVTLDAILVSTKSGARYFVSDRFAVFSQSLLLNAIKSESALDYQIAWLPNVSIGAQASVGPLLAFLRDSVEYYGVGIQKVKHLFKTARKHGPVVIFIDEADGLAARTSGATGSADAESNRIINQLLAEMDGFEKNEGVILVAATNFPENLDEALRRPGRFDRIVPGDVLVNSADIAGLHPFTEFPLDHFRRIVEVDVRAARACPTSSVAHETPGVGANRQHRFGQGHSHGSRAHRLRYLQGGGDRPDSSDGHRTS